MAVIDTFVVLRLKRVFVHIAATIRAVKRHERPLGAVAYCQRSMPDAW